MLVEIADPLQDGSRERHVRREQVVTVEPGPPVHNGLGRGDDRGDGTLTRRLDPPGDDGLPVLVQPRKQRRQPGRVDPTVVMGHGDEPGACLLQTTVRRIGDAGLGR
jgi:hypothetical protein